MTDTERNWAGSHTYAAPVLRPGSVAELQELVAVHDRVRALGSRHSFTDLPDAVSADGEPGVLVELGGLPSDVVLDGPQVTVGAGTTFGELGAHLHQSGWALATLASLPHISVAGAVATGTHGSGPTNRNLAALVAALEVVGPDGALRRVGRGDADFAGTVVGLGALGVVTRVTLDVVPTYDVRQEVWHDLPWGAAVDELVDLDQVLGSAYSVSLFTDWAGDTVPQVWVKQRADADLPDLAPARRADGAVHMISGADTGAVTRQGGVPGPWHERLPHFRADRTPSQGEELQTEYFVPREAAAEAFRGLRARADLMAPLLLTSEVRTVAADDLWLSGAYERDAVALHFTWRRDWDGVHAVLPVLEELLVPLGARPHWGKCFTVDRSALDAAYPRLDDFRALRARVDPAGVFGNAWLDRVL